LTSGYGEAERLALERLKGLNIDEVCARTASEYADGGYYVRWLGDWRRVSEGKPAERILWLHYLTHGGIKKITGRLIAYREIPTAMFYEPAFVKRAVRPIIKRFGSDTDGLIKAGAALGGERAEYGDAAIAVPCLPCVPVTYVVWAGDGELPADAAVLFDESAKDWLPAEDLAVLASLGAYALCAVK